MLDNTFRMIHLVCLLNHHPDFDYCLLEINTCKNALYICDHKIFSQLNNVESHTNAGQRKRRKIEEEKYSSGG